METKEILLSASLPAKTDSYQPISHAEVISMTMEALDKHNLIVIGEHYSAARDGLQASGSYTIQGGDEEMFIRLMWQNSYNKTQTLKWCIGGHVFICGNGCVSGDMGAFKRKHTGTIIDEYEQAILEYCAHAGDIIAELISAKERFKQVAINSRVAAELVGRLFIEEDIVTPTQVNIIKREIDHPTYDYKANDTLWQLYNHCTFAMKETHPQYIINNHIALHKFFNDYAIRF